ncbi:MAG: IS21 family transposase [Thermodesulfobacteriota bacterium]
MPGKRLTMRKIREVLRLKFEFHLTNRQIAKSTGAARSSIGDYLRRFENSGLPWPLPEDLDDDQLEGLFFSAAKPAEGKRPLPDWSYIHRELRKKAVTLMLLWEEYKSVFPEGYQYSQFCHLYHQWKRRIDPVMRLDHRAGEVLFVDWAGMTIDIVDPETGSCRPASIFVAAMGASSYTYAEATLTQELGDWIGAHIRAFAFFGGVPELLVPDNTKTGVTKACFYEPDLNPTYLDMARYYQTAVLPTRVKKPQDKAKVESAVQVVERWILARLRNETFFSLAELNRRIRELLGCLNNRPFQKLDGCRCLMFEQIDKPALKPLPTEPYRFAVWKKATVNIDYHIEVEGHYYSIPYKLFGKQVDVRITDVTIECFRANRPVATHRRNDRRGGHTTVKEHMPPAHRRWLEWTPERFIRWATKIGPNAAALIGEIIDSKLHPQQGFRAALGILRLGKSYDVKRLEIACSRARLIGARSYSSVASILKHGLDKKTLPPETPKTLVIDHDNIRGSNYYH